jgi:tetratricopeptide (TPR) repeat protein
VVVKNHELGKSPNSAGPLTRKQDRPAGFLERLRWLLTHRVFVALTAIVLLTAPCSLLLEVLQGRPTTPGIARATVASFGLLLLWIAVLILVKAPKVVTSPSPRPLSLRPDLPLRNPHFTGREELLSSLHLTLSAGKTTVVTQAIAGLGGIGKTQLAIEYCHRHALDYKVIWWLRAEEPTSLAADFAALADRLGLPERDDQDQTKTVVAVRLWLEKNRGWLLVFDNAQNPVGIRDYLPRGCPGCIIITSRHQTWSGVASELPLLVLPRPESVEFILKRTELEDKILANKLAEALGDLPLAMEQAAAYVVETSSTIAHYLELLATSRADVLKWRSEDAEYPDPVATTWEVSFRALEKKSQIGAALLKLVAFLAADDIPLDLLLTKDATLPSELVPAVADPMQLDRAKAALKGLSLANFAGDNMSVHRLVQAVIEDRVGAAGKRRWAGAALAAVSSVYPSDGGDVQRWPQCARLTDHALAVSAAEGVVEARPVAGRLLNRVGIYLRSRALLAEAELAFSRALSLDERAYGPDHPDVARDLIDLALLMRDRDRPAEAEALLWRALRIHERIYGPDHSEVAVALNDLALALESQNKLAEAEPLSRRALSINEKALDPHHLAVATTLNTLARLLQAQGKPAEAEPLLRRALSISEKVFGPEHTIVALALNNLAEVLRAQRKLAEAEPLFRRALVIQEKAYGPDHPLVAATLGNLALLLWDQDKLLEAEPLLRRALGIHEKVFGPEHTTVARDLNNLGRLLLVQKRLTEVEALFLRARRIVEKAQQPEPLLVAAILRSLALLRLDQGKKDEAALLLQRALEIAERALGPEHPSTKAIRQSLEKLRG